MRLACLRPAECAPAELESFAGLLDLAFGPRDRTRRIGQARALVFLTNGRELAGIAAIKSAGRAQRCAVFGKAGVTLAGPPPRHELGWVVVDGRHRGQGCPPPAGAGALPPCLGARARAQVGRPADLLVSCEHVAPRRDPATFWSVA